MQSDIFIPRFKHVYTLTYGFDLFSIPVENRKPSILLCFPGVEKETSCKKKINEK